MSVYTIQDSTLTNIADAIRTKGGTTETLTPADMAQAVTDLPEADTTLYDMIFDTSGTLDVEIDADGQTPRSYCFDGVNVNSIVLDNVTLASVTQCFQHASTVNTFVVKATTATDYTYLCSSYLTIGDALKVSVDDGKIGGQFLSSAKFNPDNDDNVTWIVLNATKFSVNAIYRPQLATSGGSATCRMSIPATATSINAAAFVPVTSGSYILTITDLYVPWSEGAVANSPWGLTDAIIHYDCQFSSEGYPLDENDDPIKTDGFPLL